MIDRAISSLEDWLRTLERRPAGIPAPYYRSFHKSQYALSIETCTTTSSNAKATSSAICMQKKASSSFGRAENGATSALSSEDNAGQPYKCLTNGDFSDLTIPASGIYSLRNCINLPQSTQGSCLDREVLGDLYKWPIV